jgi:rhodanese-related sulfurtransferase
LAEMDRITVDEVKRRMDKGEPMLLIDTRNLHDWGESDVKLPGARRIHYSELEQHLGELPRDRTIVTYCT